MARILIVDDSEDILDLCKHWLGPLDHDILLAKNGYDALDILYTYTIDVLLLDLTMPQINGFELIERLKKSPRFNALTIAILTGRSDQHDVNHAIRLGVKNYFVKPLEKEVFLEAVQKIIPYQPVSKNAEVLLDMSGSDPEQATVQLDFKLRSISELGITFETPIPLVEDQIYQVEANLFSRLGLESSQAMKVTSVITGSKDSWVCRLMFVELSDMKRTRIQEWILLNNRFRS